MNRNPLIPFAIIAVLGIILMFVFSFKGIGDHKNLASGGEKEEKTENVANASPEELYQKQGCISCHGQNYEGGAGPALSDIGKKVSLDEIKDTLKNGRGAMPAGLVPDEKIDEMAEWVSKLK